MKAIAALLLSAGLAAAFPGCVSDPFVLTCGERATPPDVPDGAPREGGDGDAAFRVTVRDRNNASIAGAAVLASWATDGAVHYVALRTSGDGAATVHAPRGASVRVWGGDTAWTGDETVVAGDPIPPRYPGADPATLDLQANTRDGFFSAFWVQTVPALGLPLLPTGGWAPQELEWAQADRLARLESLDLRLAWRNDSNGIVDLAIAVGRGDEWTQWNAAIDATQGHFQEDLHLDRAMLQDGGWTSGAGLQVGPALGAGGGFTSPLGKGQLWDLRWTARFAQDTTLGDVCAGHGLPVARDVTSG